MGAKRHGSAMRGKKTRLYLRWVQMRSRCNNPNCDDFKHYGGRGIAVCAEWDDFELFELWAKRNGYSDELEIDRIDNSKGYSPNNCRWVSKSENMLNRRRFKNNSTGYTGVCYSTSKKKYIASIDRRKKRFYLGAFTELKDAVSVREKAMKMVEYYENIGAEQ